MASVDFMKLKSPQSIKAQIRHCDKEERLKSNHSNKDIDKSITLNNLQGGKSYEQVCKRYDNRIKELDSNPKQNTRKDRVTCFGLEIPCPVTADKELDWIKNVTEILIKRYKGENILNVYFHRDEKHDYIDPSTGKKRTSVNHLHAFVIPEIDGILCGKQFSSAKAMRSLNQEIHKMTKDNYGVDFMNGTQMKSRDSVEALKFKSREAELNLREQSVKQREQGVTSRDMAINQREQALDRRENALKTLENDLNDKSIELDNEIVSVRQIKAKNSQINAKWHALYDDTVKTHKQLTDDVQKKRQYAAEIERYRLAGLEIENQEEQADDELWKYSQF